MAGCLVGQPAVGAYRSTRRPPIWRIASPSEAAVTALWRDRRSGGLPRSQGGTNTQFFRAERVLDGDPFRVLTGA